MNKENTNTLVADFAQLYRIDSPWQEAGSGFAFECGNGWFRLLHDLSGAIHNQAVREGKDLGDEAFVYARQVKETFGTLRFYLANGSPAMQDLIRAAEERSSRTCEMCGLAGTLLNDGWLKVRCDSCKSKGWTE
jgi:hypothetical protein